MDKKVEIGEMKAKTKVISDIEFLNCKAAADYLGLTLRAFQVGHSASIQKALPGAEKFVKKTDLDLYMINYADMLKEAKASTNS